MDRNTVVALLGVAAAIAGPVWVRVGAAEQAARFLTQPLVKEIYTADPSAHVFGGRIYVYHDSQLSGGQTHLRNVKVTELKHRPDGSIMTIDAYTE